jgi:hypothetical protein
MQEQLVGEVLKATVLEQDKHPVGLPVQLAQG